MALVGVAVTASEAQPDSSADPLLPAKAPPASPLVEAVTRTFATLPTSGATQDLCQSPDGTIYVTLLDEHRLLKITPGGTVTQFADPPDAMHLLGIACPTNNEIVVVAYHNAFRAPPSAGGAAYDFSDTGCQVLVFDAVGRQTASLRLPANVALNGISGTAGGVYFAADSNSGSIYRLDLPMKRAEVWFRDD